MKLPIVDFTLLYNGKDISSDVSDQVLSIEYDDKIKGESDELNILLEDTDKRWQNSWYPEKGASLQLFIRDRYQQLDCGTFVIDENEISGSIDGDNFLIRALAAAYSKKMRSVVSRTHENKSIREIANTVAAGLGLTVQGTIKDFRPARTNQYRETDLQFLNRLASQYGYIFSVRGSQLIFTHYKEIEDRQPSLILNRTDLLRFNIKDSSHLTYKNGRIRYHVPQKKKVISFSTGDDDDDTKAAESTAGDDLEMYDRCEDEEQAETIAAFGLHNANSKMVGGDISVPGNPLILSGNNVQLQGIGKLSGIYNILGARHSISRDQGYGTTATLKRVKLIDPSLYK
jgi:phage protein D